METKLHACAVHCGIGSESEKALRMAVSVLNLRKTQLYANVAQKMYGNQLPWNVGIDVCHEYLNIWFVQVSAEVWMLEEMAGLIKGC